MNRREMLKATGTAALAAGLSSFPFGWTPAAAGAKKRILMFTKSAGFEHPVIKRKTPGELSHAERIVTDFGAKHGFEVHATKDGRIFIPEEIAKFDAFFFYTTEDLTKENTGDKNPPMPPGGKEAFLKAIEQGKGFIGTHCASDTFHSMERGPRTQPPDKRDPYINMIGGEFITHGAQQKAWMRVVSPNFPGAKGMKDFHMYEEWYALKNFAPDLHVILAQDSEGMKGGMYNRPLFPATWARMHGKGRVFYTSMGHGNPAPNAASTDVWRNPIFHEILLGGIAWALGNVEADVTPNVEKVTPKANDLQKA